MSIEFIERSISNSSFDFYEMLADFYYMKGFQKQSHSKEDIYRILYAFVCENKDRLPAGEAKHLIEEDLIRTMNPDAVKKFKKKGWELN
ncbi:DUF4080 domain-containing protein, partial [Priestia megaterium]|uniref:DUF4080 domain-containing protein n=1 Tax=Priestia megaterium TaxID=1404 RepID=UPI00283F4941